MKYFLSSLLLIFFWPQLSLWSQITLLSNGHTVYNIIIPEVNNDQEKTAATMLQNAIEAVSGAKMNIAKAPKLSGKKKIYITTNPDAINLKKLTKPHQDGFYIYTDKSNIIIYGGAKRGVVYGVVHFLGKYLDCRWYAPHFSVFPKKESITIPPLNEYIRPDNDIRIINGEYTRNSKEYRDWLMINEISEEFPNGYFVHTFHKIIPANEYFETHPEFFSEVNGKRTKDQLCVSHPEVLRLTIRKLREEMAKQPGKNLWSVSQNDNPFFCSCDRCTHIIKEENAPSGPLIRFINAIADSFPQKTISTLAYQFSRKAPSITKPRKNVQIMLCTIELNRSQAIAEDPRSISFLDDIINWGKISDHIFLWDYTVDFAHHITPFPNFHVLQPNIKFFHNHGAKVQFQQSNVDIGHSFSELKAYLISKILWDVDADQDSIMNEFLTGYYGNAAPWIKKYMMKTQSELIHSGEFLDIYGHPTAHQNSFLSEENVRLYDEWFDEAEKSVIHQPEYLNHVRVARLQLMYAKMEIGKSAMFGSRGFYELDKTNLKPKAKMTKMVDEFLEICKSNNVKNVNESGLSPTAYILSTKRTLKIKKEGNLAFGNTVKLEPMPAEKYSEGNPTLLTNGVYGSNDYRVHWLGWEGKDFEVTLDFEEPKDVDSIQISSLYLPNSWILHPKEVKCMIYDQQNREISSGNIPISGDQKNEDVNKTYNFVTPGQKVTKIKLYIKSAGKLPHWHPANGGTAWTFVDELVVYGGK